MWQGRRWVGVAGAAAVAATLCLGGFGLAPAADAGTQVLDWNVTGSVDVGGMYTFGDRNSSKFNDYRDMDNGFLGELYLKGEKKDSPYYFELGAKNPTRDDQSYEGAFGRYGLFNLELEWDGVRHVLGEDAGTIFQLNGSAFSLPPPPLRTTIQQIFTGTGGQPSPTSAAGRANISGTINGLLRPVELGFNTNVGTLGFKLTPTEALRFDLEYSNRRNEGYRAQSATMASSVVAELAIPLDQTTHEAKFGAEYAKQNYALRFNYTASIFENNFQSYRWDNPVSTTGTQARGEFSAAPDNMAQTFALTGRAALPWWRTNVSGAFSYTTLRQDETFNTNVAAGLPGATNADNAGMTSPDAKSNLVAGNILLTSRPINSVTATARYRFFEYENDTPMHAFTNRVAQNGNVTAGTFTTNAERYTRQNAGLDIVWRPNRQVSVKGGYEYEYWHRGDFDGKDFGTAENIAKVAVDLTPVNWFLGRVSYTYGIRNLGEGYGIDPLAGNGVGFYKFNYADRVRNRVDTLFQFSRWETFTPSFNFSYANDNFNNSAYGLTDDTNYSAGVSLSWTPLKWLTLSADYTYENHDYTQVIRGGANANAFKTRSNDQFNILSVGAIMDVIPKKLDLNLSYGVTFGYTDINSGNLYAGCVGAACAFGYPTVQNVQQAARAVARYHLTEKLSLRGGFAYERFSERNFARDPMAPFMGYFDTSTAGSQSVWLGATTPSYETYTIAAFLRYEL
jgi:MtrB/PioB family decaheme-associated outer membrane protein